MDETYIDVGSGPVRPSESAETQEEVVVNLKLGIRWWLVIPLIVMAFVVPQIVLAADETPPTVSPQSADCYYDYGDLPDTYHTLNSNNGPYHEIGSLWLGNHIDNEWDGQESNNALGDDTHGSTPDDEDGVFFDPSAVVCRPGATLSFRVTINANPYDGPDGWIAAWFDLDRNGSFSIEERTVLEAYYTTPQNIVQVTLPDDWDCKTDGLNARFRLYPKANYGSQPAMYPTGGASGGEVEDYHWTFNTTAVTLAGPAQAAGFAPLQLLAPVAALVTVTAGWVGSRKRH